MQTSLLSGILLEKCPRCRRGNIFAFPAWQITKFYHTHIHCPVCNTKFEKEPGFFFGAMFIGYAFVVGSVLIVSFALHLFLSKVTLPTYLLAAAITIIISFPFNFRFSRVIYLYLFTQYQKDAALRTDIH